MMEYGNNGTMEGGKEGRPFGRLRAGSGTPHPPFHHSSIPTFHPSRPLRLGLTDAGKVILRGIVFIALAALIIPAFDVLSVLVAVCLVALAVGFVFRPRTLVTGNLPDRIIAGQTAHLTYTIENLGRRSAYNLRVRFHGLPEGIEQLADAQTVPVLAPGQTAEVAVTIRPKRRGCYRIRGPACESSFPFNLFHFGVSREGEESLIVLPVFSLLDLSLPYVSRHVDVSSLRPAGRLGTSPEYIGNRPYQPGDPPHRIDVRAWARLAAPATKEYDDDLDNYAALVLDTRLARPEGRGRRDGGREEGRRPAGRRSGHAPRPPGPVPSAKELEAAVSLCASVAYTLQHECLIDLLLAGPDLHSFASLPKELRLDRVHETLAAVEPAPDYPVEQLGSLLEDRLGAVSEIVFVLLHWDHTYQQLAQWAEQAGCHCTVIVVGEASASDCGLGIGDGGLKEAIVANPQSEIHNPQWAVASTGDVRFVAADDILAGRRDPL